MLGVKRKVRLQTERLTLRPPTHGDFRPWTALRSESRDFLTPWEPTWAPEHLSRKAFTNRVYWAQRSISSLRLYHPRSQPDRGGLPARKYPVTQFVRKVRVQVRRRGAKLSADQRTVAEPCSVCKFAV